MVGFGSGGQAAGQARKGRDQRRGVAAKFTCLPCRRQDGPAVQGRGGSAGARPNSPPTTVRKVASSKVMLVHMIAPVSAA